MFTDCISWHVAYTLYVKLLCLSHGFRHKMTLIIQILNFITFAMAPGLNLMHIIFIAVVLCPDTRSYTEKHIASDLISTEQRSAFHRRYEHEFERKLEGL